MAGLIASLGMYDSPANAAALDRLWALIREALADHAIAAPAALTRGPGAWLPAWQDPALLLSQTCGYPLRTLLRGRVTLIGAADHGLADTPPGHYHSVLVARQDDPRESFAEFSHARFAWNEDLSQSGWAAPWQFARENQVRLNPVYRSGGHRASAAALRAGKADLAALDAVTWAMMGEDGSGDARGLRVIACTPPTPALPFITARGRDPLPLFAALSSAISALNAAESAQLHLKALVSLGEADYWAIPNPPSPAQSDG